MAIIFYQPSFPIFANNSTENVELLNSGVLKQNEKCSWKIMFTCILCFVSVIWLVIGCGLSYLILTFECETNVNYVHNCCFAVGEKDCFTDSEVKYCYYTVSYVKLSPEIVSDPNQFNSTLVSDKCPQLMLTNSHQTTTISHLKEFTPTNSTLCYSNANETQFTFNQPYHSSHCADGMKIVLFGLIFISMLVCSGVAFAFCFGLCDKKQETKEKVENHINDQYEEL